MKILHLYSNWKWTGPAELAVNLCQGLAARGHDVFFAGGRKPTTFRYPIHRKDAEGVQWLRGLNLSKHYSFWGNPYDCWKLPGVIKTTDAEILHCHLKNDFRVASSVRNGSSPDKVIWVRTLYQDPSTLQGWEEERLVGNDGPTGIFVPAESARESIFNRYSTLKGRVFVVPCGVNTTRFDPERPLPDMRRKLNLGDGDFVVGVVARIQKHRRFEVLLEAAHRLHKRLPHLRVVVVGRGTHMRSVAIEPAHKMGLDEVVHFTGYLRKDEFVGTLKAFDALVFLQPGTDGTCRAVREAMAMGVPPVVANVGLLPDLVANGQEGLLIEPEAEPLSDALSRLHEDATFRRELGLAARRKALDHWTLDQQAEVTEKAYRELLESR